MNIYKHELKANFVSTLLWIIAISGITSLMITIYPSFNEEMVKVFENLPAIMKNAFSIVVENFTTAIGFYTFAITYTVLFGAIQAMNLGVGIVSKEERERTADFLMTKPVSRVKILTSKLLAALTIFIIVNVIYSAITYTLINYFSEGDFDVAKFALINLGLFFSQLIFFSIGLIVSIAAKKIKSVLPVSLGLVFAFFAISAFAVTSTEDKLRYLTPFQYFKASYIVAEGKFESVYPFVGLFIVVASIVASYVIYKRKNVHAV